MFPKLYWDETFIRKCMIENQSVKQKNKIHKPKKNYGKGW